MEIFALDDDVARWDAALPSLHDTARLPVLLPLAWHLRQRNTRRAVLLADAALTQLGGAGALGGVAHADALRMMLVKAEARWLAGELDAAEQNVLALSEHFRALNDAAGSADSYYLLGSIAVDQGDHARSDSMFAAAAAAAVQAGDTKRAALADATSARWAVLRERDSAVRIWGQRITPEMAQLHPGIAVWVNDFMALAASLAGDFGTSARYGIRCFETAQETGQLRAAITAATNIGEDFTTLNDDHGALEWMQNALGLARPAGWPRSVGACLMHTANTLRRLGRLDAAEAMLHEALQILAPLINARSYAKALLYLGDLALDQGRHRDALDAFCQGEARADALNHADLRCVARRGRAHALSYLGRAADALEVAASALELAANQHHPHNQIAALRVMANIHSRHRLPAPPMNEHSAALHYLNAARAVAATINDYLVPGELLDAVAHEYAAVGDYVKAYQLALEAGAARDRVHRQEASNRAIAMHVHHQSEHARSESDHHRALAESEARRAEVLERTSSTLERLSAIGQEITGHLTTDGVFNTLDLHIHGLLAANTVAVYLLDDAGAVLLRAFGVEMGQAMAPHSIALNTPDSCLTQCVTERREVVIDGVNDVRPACTMPGTLTPQSALFAPLSIGERVIGVMTVQSIEPNAFGEQERLIFRTLCAYGAIALDNAEAYRRLKDAQTQLVSQEKLAALGSLMAGVAHELNTPIGNSLLIASTLQEKTHAIELLVNGPGIRRSDLSNYIADALKASTLVMRGLTSAADLVSSFKQVAVDRTTEQRRMFNLQLVCHEVIATMMNRIRAAKHSIELQVDAMITLDSYPGPFGQVITNFIHNALLHAFDNDKVGHMLLSATMQADDRVLVRFSDDGHGIAEEHLTRIFDPFFTTKLGQGGSGLGLSISYNIVTQLMGGSVNVRSNRSEGTTLTLDLPLTAPAHDPAQPASIY